MVLESRNFDNIRKTIPNIYIKKQLRFQNEPKFSTDILQYKFDQGENVPQLL